MSCGCGKHAKAIGGEMDANEYAVTAIAPPEAPCVFCAEKHLSLAHEIFEREPGYSGINRQRVVGQLAASEWHLYKEHRELCAKVRALRHAIQSREFIDASQWIEILCGIDSLANEAAKRLNDVLTSERRWIREQK